MIENDERVVEMRLCESSRLVLRPGQLYRFSVDPTCPACVALSRSLAPQETPQPEPACACGLSTVGEGTEDGTIYHGRDGCWGA